MEFRRVTWSLLKEALPAEHVVCVWSGGRSEAEASEVAVQRSVEALSVVQALVKQGSPARLWWVTSGAVSLGGEKPVTLETSPLWGLGRTVMQEHSGAELQAGGCGGRARVPGVGASRAPRRRRRRAGGVARGSSSRGEAREGACAGGRQARASDERERARSREASVR